MYFALCCESICGEISDVLVFVKYEHILVGVRVEWVSDIFGYSVCIGCGIESAHVDVKSSESVGVV